MLAADKHALLTDVRRGYLALREKEMNFLNDNYRAIGKQVTQHNHSPYLLECGNSL